LSDSDQTVVDCDQGFAARHSGFCDSANPDWTCCAGASPSYLCAPGSHCAALEGGGFCCSSTAECIGRDSVCGGDRTCCSGLTCRSNYCRAADFDSQCTEGGKTCVMGSTNCCEGFVCRSVGGAYFCAPPGQGGGQQN
jgi:hypothetical protein